MANTVEINFEASSYLGTILGVGGLAYTLAWDTTLSRLRGFDGVATGGYIFAIQSDITGTWPLANAQNATATTGGTLTASILVPSLATTTTFLERSGPTSAFTDTFDTAADIINAMLVTSASVAAGATFTVKIFNGSAAVMTIAPGTGITFAGCLDSGDFTIGPNSPRIFALVATNIGTPAVTIYG